MVYLINITAESQHDRQKHNLSPSDNKNANYKHPINHNQQITPRRLTLGGRGAPRKCLRRGDRAPDTALYLSDTFHSYWRPPKIDDLRKSPFKVAENWCASTVDRSENNVYGLYPGITRNVDFWREKGN